jgi:threonine aldolase
MTPIDLRSDTVTKPTPAMRAAMAEAEVGDDVFGDDPTVNRLQAVAAELLGKESALFVPSGTMANLVSVMTHTRPGDEIVLGDQSHILVYEVAGAARIANVMTRPVRNGPGGGLDPAEVDGIFRERSLHTPQTSLLCLENTHNRCGGGVLAADEVAALAGVAHAHGAAVHLDGARIFNAQVALETPAAEIARGSDSVSFCLSKGLGCPVGSLVCGSRAFVEEARRNRKMLGGGMRQAGILAAAGLYALEHNVRRLAEDHANAKRLAEGLRRIGPFATNDPETNIVMVDLTEGTSAGWAPTLAAAGVLVTVMSTTRLRMVTNLGVSEADIADALERIEGVCSRSAE